MLSLIRQVTEFGTIPVAYHSMNPTRFSKVERLEQAAHLAQPAFTVSEVIPASLSHWPTGPSTLRRNSAEGGRCAASGVPLNGTNGTMKG